MKLPARHDMSGVPSFPRIVYVRARARRTTEAAPRESGVPLPTRAIQHLLGLSPALAVVAEKAGKSAGPTP